MRKLKTFILFFICNAVGSFIGPAIAILAVNTRFLDLEKVASTALSPDQPLPNEITLVLACWLACALFSFSVFFLSGFWKTVFLAAPIVIPTLATLLLLSMYV